MAETTLMFPILGGMTGELERFASRLSGPDAELFNRSQRRLGIVRESWFLHHTAAGDFVIVYVEADDLVKTLGALVASQDPDDRMLKQEVQRLTGIDFDRAPGGTMPRQLLRFRA